jgi:hypothetical protein
MEDEKSGFFFPVHTYPFFRVLVHTGGAVQFSGLLDSGDFLGQNGPLFRSIITLWLWTMESRYEKKDKQKTKNTHFLFICGNNQGGFIYLFIYSFNFKN